ncbi:UNVERIFIED_CONTAM: hypothetical protein GTU68_059255 [Idotea baltica]|nr:hypothetical protein [Idotea baltica]
MKYKRILLKLSGEALMGNKNFGIDPLRLEQYTNEIKKVTESGVELAIVIGGGNIFRGIQAEQSGMDRVQGDYMGMLATVINAMALQSALEGADIYTRLMSGIKIDQVCEQFIRRRAIRHLEKGRAMPNMLDGLMVEYYGNPTPLSQVASINTPDAKTLAIKPWEKSLLAEIEKSIVNSDLGLNPQNDGEIVRLNIPPLTEERRRDLVKQTKQEGENGKVSVRNVRKEANESLRQLIKEHVSEDDVKRSETKVQDLTNSFIQKIDDLLAKKEEEIMTV